MGVPRYQEFIEPILRFLATRESGASQDEVREHAARVLELSEEDCNARHKSGALMYRNRAGWAFDRLKRSGLAAASDSGVWQLTARGHEFARLNPFLTKTLIAQIAATKTESRQPGPKVSRAVSHSEVLGTEHPRSDRKAYRLPPRPLSEGGQADVFEAVRKADSSVFILKRGRGAANAKRMKREIEIQSSMIHPNIMPIVDWDGKEYSWYVMPRGHRVMADLERPVEFGLLCAILEHVLNALEYAHGSGHPHRDVKPDNIIELVENGTPRWVLADWGLTRRPLGETTSALTKTGHLLGTVGFAPPEAYLDGHSVGEVGDIFSLGQVIAWATGVTPAPNMVPNVAEPWTQLVKSMTRLEPESRLQTITEVRQALRSICQVSSPNAVSNPNQFRAPGT